jgi:hypothetical protein
VTADERLSIVECLLFAAATGVFYLFLFIMIGIGRDERRRYITKLRSITGTPGLTTRPAPHLP